MESISRFKIIVILSLAVMFTGCNKHIYQEEQMITTYIPEKIEKELGAEQLSISIYNDRLYVLTDKGLFDNDDSSYLIEREYKEASCIDIREDKIAIYSAGKLCLYNLKGELLDEVNIEGEPVNKIRIQNNKVYFTKWDSNVGYLKNLFYYEIESQIINPIQLPSLIYSFDINSENKLLVAYEGEKNNEHEHEHASSINVGSVDLEKENYNTIDVIYTANADDIYIEDMVQYEDAIYICGYNGVAKLKLNSKNIEMIFENRAGYIEGCVDQIIKSDKEIYLKDKEFTYKLVNSDKPLLRIIPVAEELHSTALTAGKKMMNENKISGVEPVIIENVSEKLKVKLLAKDSDFDIMPLSFKEAQNIGIDYIMPITNEEYLKDIYSIYFETYKKITSVEKNQVLGIPHCSSTDVFYFANTDEFDGDKSKLADRMDDWNWYDFFDLSMEYAKDIDSDGENDIWLTDWTAHRILGYLVECYITDERIKEQEFREVLLKLKQTNKGGGIVDDNNINHTILNSIELSLTNPNVDNKDNTDFGYYLLPNVNKDNEVYLIDGIMYCINRFSSNAKLAEELLVNMMEPETVIPTSVQTWYADEELYNSCYNRYIEENEDELDLRKEGYILPMTPKIYETLDRVYANSVISKIDKKDEKYRALLEAYLNDTIQVDEFIENLNSYK